MVVREPPPSVTSSASRTRSSPAATTRCCRSETCSTTAAPRAEFAGSYVPSWGRLKAITHPAVGNHEYGSPGAAPYFQYFGAGCRRAGQGLLLLRPGLVAPDRAQFQLRADRRLRAPARLRKRGCRRISLRTPCAARSRTGTTRSSPRARTATPSRCARSGAISTQPAQTSCSTATTMITSGSRRRTPRASRDDARGIREFVVGTGGKNHMTFRAIEPNSDLHDTTQLRLPRAHARRRRVRLAIRLGSARGPR